MQTHKRGEIVELNRDHIPALGFLWVTCRDNGESLVVEKVESYLPGHDAIEYNDVTHFYSYESLAPKFFQWIKDWYKENKNKSRQSCLENRGIDEAKDVAI